MDILGRYRDIFVNAADAKADGSNPDDEMIYEAMCYSYYRIDAHPGGAETKREILQGGSRWAQSWIAAQVLSAGPPDYVSEAKKVLEELSSASDMVGFTAGTTLAEYESGSLRPPLRFNDAHTLRWLDKANSDT